MATPPSRLEARPATVLLGLGELGREVVRRFLVNAALRDELEWETAADGGRAERRLAGLAVFHLPDDRRSAAPPGGKNGSGETDLELLRDVERQIQDLEAGVGREKASAQEVVKACGRLLEARPAGSPRLPGLTLLVVAQPATREAVGRLETVTQEIFTELGRLPNLRRGVSSAAPLAALAVLDFDNYWDSSPAARGLRRGLAAAGERWQARRGEGTATFGRVFLTSGINRQRVRRPEFRIDEISLFLELLLGEARWQEDLERLYRAPAAQEALFGTFGVRLFEHNEALVRQLVAARFGAGWLAYLAGGEPAGSEDTAGRLQARLGTFLPGTLESELGWSDLETDFARRLAELERELLARSPERADWPAALWATWQEHRAAFDDALPGQVRLVAGPLGERLGRWGNELGAALDEALTVGHAPLPVGAVVHELEAFRARLEPAVLPEPPPGEPLEGYQRRLEGLGRRLRAERGERLAAGPARWLAVSLALVLAVGWTTFARELLAEGPAPGPAASVVARWLHAASGFLAHPVTTSVGLVGLGLVAAHGFVRPLLARYEGRLARRFLDPAQGRVADLVRAGLAEGGALAAPMAAELERRRRDLAAHAANSVERELGRVLSRLREVRREMLWLRDQLTRFLALYGLSPDGRSDRLDLVRRDDTGIRRRLERADDLARLARRLPAEAATFRALQGDERILAAWREALRSPFLYPLEFLERLGAHFRAETMPDRRVASPAPDEVEASLMALVRHPETFDLAFDWRAREGVPAAERFAVLPRAWQEWPVLGLELQGVGIGGGRQLTAQASDRAYLVTVQTGLGAGLLEESS